SELVIVSSMLAAVFLDFLFRRISKHTLNATKRLAAYWRRSGPFKGGFALVWAGNRRLLRRRSHACASGKRVIPGVKDEAGLQRKIEPRRCKNIDETGHAFADVL